MSESESVNETMSEAANSCVEYARQSFGITLDYSDASIEKVESMLSRIYLTIPRGFWSKITKKAPPPPKKLEQISLMFGGYIAEVIKRQFGGTWKMESALYPGQTLLTFQAGAGGDMWPHLKVGMRLENGPVDSVWSYYRFLRGKFENKT